MTNPNTVAITANASLGETYTSIPSPKEAPADASLEGNEVQGLTLKPGQSVPVMLGHFHHKWQWIPEKNPLEEDPGGPRWPRRS